MANRQQSPWQASENGGDRQRGTRVQATQWRGWVTASGTRMVTLWKTMIVDSRVDDGDVGSMQAETSPCNKREHQATGEVGDWRTTDEQRLEQRKKKSVNDRWDKWQQLLLFWITDDDWRLPTLATRSSTMRIIVCAWILVPLSSLVKEYISHQLFLQVLISSIVCLPGFWMIVLLHHYFLIFIKPLAFFLGYFDVCALFITLDLRFGS